ncbi:MAG TPA: hypothetical protein VGC19_06320 [Rhodanobacter sp.]
MNNKLRVGIAIVGALIIKVMFLGYQRPLATFVTWAILSVLVWAILGAFTRTSGKHGSMPADFQAAFTAKNIALDTANDRVWLRPDRGSPLVLEGSKISAWTHEWVVITAGVGMGQKRNNRIVFTVKDLARPTLSVKFSSYRLAEEWQARLTAWKNA